MTTTQNNILIAEFLNIPKNSNGTFETGAKYTVDLEENYINE